MGVPHLRLRAYYAYSYGCTTPAGYRHTMLTATGVSRLHPRACCRRTMGVWRGVSQPLVTTAAIAKGKSDDWLRNGLLDASVARPFLPPFSPCTMTLPRKWRRGSGLATQGYSDTSAIQTLKELRIIQLRVHAYVAMLRTHLSTYVRSC